MPQACSRKISKDFCEGRHFDRFLQFPYPVPDEFGQLREHRVQPACGRLFAKRNTIRLGVRITHRPYLTIDPTSHKPGCCRNRAHGDLSGVMRDGIMRPNNS